MTNKFKTIIFIVTLTALTSGCLVTYGDNTISKITKIENTPCTERANKIYMFFEGEKIDFTYKKIGLVEAQGNNYALNNKVINHLKYSA